MSTSPPNTLLALLEPWRWLVTAYFKLTEIRIGPDGVAGVATLQATKAQRHVMELLSVAMLLDATLLGSMVDAYWLENGSSHSPTIISSVVFDVAVGGALNQEELFDRTLTELFLTRQDADVDEALDAVREELLRRVEDAGKTQQLLRLRVPVVCTLSCLENEPSGDPDDEPPLPPRMTDAIFYEQLPSPDRVVRLFEHVVLMGQRVIRMERCFSMVPWAQFTLSKLRLGLDVCLPLTPDVVRAARALSRHKLVTVFGAKLDPRTICCSQDELSAYLRALSRHSPDFYATTGHFPYSNLMTPIDASGEDRKDVIVKIMTALVSCTKLRAISVGGLLSLLTQPHNRLHYWRTLLEIVLAPVSSLSSDASATPRRKFCLQVSTALTDQDAGLIQQIPGLTTRRRRRVDSFAMHWSGPECEAPTLAVLSLVRDMERLNITNYGEMISALAVSAMLQRSPKLRSICLTNAEIPSLEVFVDPSLSASGNCLQEITLFCVRPIAQSSVKAVLTQLLDASTPLARSLRVLRLFSEDFRKKVIDRTNAELLERVLCVNQRLQHIYLLVADDTPSMTRDALRSHNGDPVWGDSSQLPATLVSQRCAFLSVVPAFDALSRVDPAVFRTVFELATPLLGKRVVTV